MRSSVGHEGSFGGNRERKKPGFLQRATATLAGLALALGGCSIGEAGAGASSSPEVTATPDTTSTAGSSSNADCRENAKDGRPGQIADSRAIIKFRERRMFNASGGSV